MNLKKFFSQNPKVALAFSGGVDSAYLLYAAKKYGADVQAYYVKSAFQPQFELDDATRLAKELDAPLKILEIDVLSHEEVVKNPTDRCYHCKKAIFTTLKNQALKDGFSLLLDGTNASDDATDRPGMKALEELSVRSPLRESSLTKPEIRALSKEAGLFTWNKPSYACLATRIPTNRKINKELLEKVEKAENHLIGLNFSDFRVRIFKDSARIEITEQELPKLLEHREKILKELAPIFKYVLLDLNCRQSEQQEEGSKS